MVWLLISSIFDLEFQTRNLILLTVVSVHGIVPTLQYFLTTADTMWDSSKSLLWKAVRITFYLWTVRRAWSLILQPLWVFFFFSFFCPEHTITDRVILVFCDPGDNLFESCHRNACQKMNIQVHQNSTPPFLVSQETLWTGLSLCEQRKIFNIQISFFIDTNLFIDTHCPPQAITLLHYHSARWASRLFLEEEDEVTAGK